MRVCTHVGVWVCARMGRYLDIAIYIYIYIYIHRERASEKERESKRKLGFNLKPRSHIVDNVALLKIYITCRVLMSKQQWINQRSYHSKFYCRRSTFMHGSEAFWDAKLLLNPNLASIIPSVFDASGQHQFVRQPKPAEVCAWCRSPVSRFNSGCNMV